MSTAVAIRKAAQIIEKPEFQQEVAKALVGETIGAQKFLRVARTALLQNPDLDKADPTSIVNAVMQCAGFGLLPDGREAAFVPFKGKCQFMPMVHGLRKKAAEHGVQIAAYCVYSNDVFEYELGLQPKIKHVPVRLGQDRGVMIGAYAVATDRDGNKYVDVMAKSEIDAIRKRSAFSDRGPWVSDYDEMAKKTVVRRSFKQVPLLVAQAPGLFAEESGFELSGRGALDSLPHVDPSEPEEVLTGDVMDDDDDDDIPFGEPSS